MISDKVSSDFGQDANLYKSCFARSVAVNSQFKQTKSTTPELEEQLHSIGTYSSTSSPQESFKISSGRPLPEKAIYDTVKLRKNSRGNMDDVRRPSSCISSVCSSRRTSISSSRIAEIPIENIVNQSKVESLQWQLKETEKSREMYKAVMKQVVTFLERTHHSLELLSTRLNTKPAVARSKSEHQILTDDKHSTLDTTYRDLTWRRAQKPAGIPEEIPPEKLSQEAFRLLRTAQSLLSTQEPKLFAHEPVDDGEFLAQLAREFPLAEPPRRTPSFSLSPKLITPDDRDARISTALNRKLSLQFNETRKSVYTKLSNTTSFRCVESVTPCSSQQRRKSFSERTRFFKEGDKLSSPRGGSVSSVEDESGFSSLNSFQDVGLPLVGNGEEVTARNVLLKSMLQHEGYGVDKVLKDEVKLWQKGRGNDAVGHRRWSSTPNAAQEGRNQTMNVLWV